MIWIFHLFVQCLKYYYEYVGLMISLQLIYNTIVKHIGHSVWYNTFIRLPLFYKYKILNYVLIWHDVVACYLVDLSIYMKFTYVAKAVWRLIKELLRILFSFYKRQKTVINFHNFCFFHCFKCHHCLYAFVTNHDWRHGTTVIYCHVLPKNLY